MALTGPALFQHESVPVPRCAWKATALALALAPPSLFTGKLSDSLGSLQQEASKELRGTQAALAH